MEQIKKLKKALKKATDPKLIKHLERKIDVLENKKEVIK